MRDTNTITMEGYGRVFCRPDVCFVNLYAEGAGYSVAKAVRECERVVSKVHEGVVAAFGSDLDLTEGDFFTGSSDDKSRRPPFEERRQGMPWVVHVKRFYFTLPAKPELAREVIDAAVVQGAVMVPSVGVASFRNFHPVVFYGIRDYDAHRRRAVGEAMQAAREDANVAASAFGKTCGSVTSILMGMMPFDRGPLGSRYDITLALPWHQLAEAPEELSVGVTARVEFELLDPEP